MNRPQSRRTFVLDSGGLIALASDEQLKALWFNEIARWEQSLIVVPATVLTETITGYPSDAKMNRLINQIGPEADVVVPTTAAIGRRAGVLRTDALAARAADPRRTISAADAEVVAIADEISQRMGVTILTSDPSDLELLVDATGRTNISVERI